MKDRDALTMDYLQSILSYDPITGVFRWLEARGRVTRGTVAGTDCFNGSKHYRYIIIDRFRYQTSRLAFLYMLGRWPKEEADHINGNSMDDRWANLREASRAENCWNMRQIRGDNKSGIRGVWRDKKSGKWCWQIHKKGRLIASGYSHKTKEEAALAVAAARVEFHGAFAS